MPLLSPLVFLLGLIVGSFLNVVIYRLGTGMSVGRGRSKCFSCGKVLHWYELIPVASFIIQRRRCRGCKSKIAWQYPAVELLTGLMFLAVWWLIPNPHFLVPIYWAIFSLLIVILIYDLRHKIIPDGPVFAFIGLSALTAAAARLNLGEVSLRFNLATTDSVGRFNLATADINWWLVSEHLLAGIILFVFFWALWYFSGGRWMGFGDAKLAAGVGLLLGLGPGITAIVLAFWSGALMGVALVLYGKLASWRSARAGKRGLTMKSEIPFAPFIILGTALALFGQLNLWSLWFF